MSFLARKIILKVIKLNSFTLKVFTTSYKVQFNLHALHNKLYKTHESIKLTKLMNLRKLTLMCHTQ